MTVLPLEISSSEGFRVCKLHNTTGDMTTALAVCRGAMHADSCRQKSLAQILPILCLQSPMAGEAAPVPAVRLVRAANV